MTLTKHWTDSLNGGVPSAGWRIREIPDCASSPKTHAEVAQTAVKDLEAFFLSHREKIGLAGFLLNGSIGSQREPGQAGTRRNDKITSFHDSHPWFVSGFTQSKKLICPFVTRQAGRSGHRQWSRANTKRRGRRCIRNT